MTNSVRLLAVACPLCYTVTLIGRQRAIARPWRRYDGNGNDHV